MKNHKGIFNHSVYAVIIALTASLAAITGCEDSITSQIQEQVRLAALPDYVLTILSPATGTVTPSGEITLKQSEPQKVNATVPGGFSFVNWEVISGSGNIEIADSLSASTTVKLNKGSATISPIITDTVYTLTTINDGHGTTTPAGATSVANNQAHAIVATPNSASGYEFDQWTKTAGAGSVVFGNSFFANTTVTVTGGDATIAASFKLQQYTVTINNDGNGSTTITSQILTHGVAGASVTANPGAEYNFVNWTVTAGSGITFTPNANTSAVTIKATAGNATVRANFAKKTYTLTIANAAAGGSVSPSGEKTATSGTPFAISATAYPTYVFNGWTQTAGAGTATFANSALASTTVTVTGGPVTITPGFRKLNVTLTEVATWTPQNDTSYPLNFTAATFIGNWLYYAGVQSTADTTSSLRRINFSSVLTPVSVAGDSVLFNSARITDIIKVGASLVIGSTSNVHKLANPDTAFSIGSVTTPTAPATPVRTLAADSASTTTFWGCSTSVFPGSSYPVELLALGTLKPVAYGIDHNGYTIEKLVHTPTGLYTVAENNGFRVFSGYDVNTYDQFTDPDSTTDVYDGGDMDEGVVGHPASSTNGYSIAIPVQNASTTLQLRMFATDDPTGVFREWDINLGAYPASATGATYDYTEGYDSYMYVSGSTGTGARIWKVDLRNGGPDTAVTGFVDIAGYSDAPYIIEKGGYLYVFLDALDTSAATRVAIKVYRIDRN